MELNFSYFDPIWISVICNEKKIDATEKKTQRHRHKKANEEKMCIFFVQCGWVHIWFSHWSANKATRMTTTMEHMQSCPIVNRKSDIIKHPFLP